MMINLQGQLNIFKAMNIRPNFSQLDRRTIKKYYNRYEGKSKTRNKVSKLHKYCKRKSTNLRPFQKGP